MRLAAALALTAVVVVAFAGCAGGGTGTVSLAQLAADDGAYFGKQVATVGRVERQHNPNRSVYFVLADRAGDFAALEPNRTVARFAGKRVVVTGKFEFVAGVGRSIDVRSITLS